VLSLDLDPERVGDRAKPAAALERHQRPRQGGGADRRRRRPVEADALERLAQYAAVERRVVRDHDSAFQAAFQLGKHLIDLGRPVDHRLRDPGESLDPPAQRHVRADQRFEAVVQLAAPDEHGADLGHLALVARETVGLGVEDEELGRRERLLGKCHRAVIPTAPDGMHRWLRRECAYATGPRGSIGGNRAGKGATVTTIATDVERLRELDADTRRAWGEYSERLRALSGEEYERVEHESWEQLQGELRELERERAAIAEHEI
jgi:hypothetical protein